jgi:uncharacterized protein YxeA
MNDTTIIIIFIILIIISGIVIIINKWSNNITYYTHTNNNENSNQISNEDFPDYPYKNINNNYFKEGNEEELKAKYDGYQNELMYKNNLKDGNYKNQFNSNGLLNDSPFQNPKSDYQIGFEPIPKNKSLTIPYANVNINCID